MQAIKHLKSLKVFHLIADNTSSVPEKVFLVEQELKAIEYALHGKVAMLGLIGPKQSLRNTVLSIERRITGSDCDSEVDIQLAPGEKAAIFIIQITSADVTEPICLVLFVTSDSFYYEKPLDTRSIYYLILRFLGDMCSNILLVYDKQIQKDFKSIDCCPYNLGNNEVVSMVMTNRSSKDITMKQFPFQSKQMSHRDFNNSDKLNLKHHNNFLISTDKIKVQMHRNKIQEELNETINQCWKSVFVKKEIDPEHVLFSIKKAFNDWNVNLIRILINEKENIYKCLRRIGEKYLSQAYSTYYKKQGSFFDHLSRTFKPIINYFSQVSYEKFYTQLYYRFVQKAQIQPKQKKYSLGDIKFVNWDVSEYLAAQVDQECKKKNYHWDIFGRIAQDLSDQIIKQVQSKVLNYFNLMHKHFIKQLEKNEELIETIMCRCEIIKSKEGTIQNLALNQNFKYCFKQQILKQKLNINSIFDIENIEFFELKNKAHKLLWIQMSPKTSSYAKLAVMVGQNIRILKTIPRSEKGQRIIDFTFFSENQKAYVINRSTKELFHFRINELQQVADQKKVELPWKNRKILCLDISIFPETLFYLTEEKNIIYTFKLQDKHQGQIFYSKKGSHQKPYKFLKEGTLYEFLKTFNEDIFIILGTKQQLDIIQPKNGKPQIRFSIKLNYSSFRGLSVFADRINEYLIVHDAKEPSAYVFSNMSARKVLQEKVRQQVLQEGNPIMDIFREAIDKFGDYSSSLQLLHLTQLDPTSIETYAEELNLKGHINTVLKPNDLFKALQKLRVLTKEAIMEIILTRIPIQICTIQQGNLETLVAGKRERSGQGKSMSVAQRSRMLNFGIIEEIMTREADKRVIVVSVMGAQSTGKSYLMNRLFGTRFTVASSRTTDGLWISLVEGKQFNYLLIDCQGLFSLDRSPKEQQKLIKIIASLSDYSIMNQNLSLTNRTFSQLMERISTTASNNMDNMKHLYNGQLFVVVRDVESNRSNEILAQYKRGFEVSETNNANLFIQKLFGGKIHFFGVSNFLLPQFRNDIQTIRKYFDRYGPERPIRTGKNILDSLKIVMTQLMCDDTQEYGSNLEDFKLQTLRQDVMQLWMRGSGQNRKYVGIVKQIEITLDEKEVCLGDSINKSQQQGKNELNPFFQILKSKVIQNHLSTVDFSKTYKEFNNFIVGFFEQRRNSVEKLIQKRMSSELASINQSKKNSFVSKLRNRILDHVSRLRLCLQTCYDCKLVCISQFGHRSSIEKQRQNTRITKLQIQKAITASDLTTQEKEFIEKRLEISEEKNKIENYHKEMELFQKSRSLQRQMEQIQSNIRQGKYKADQLQYRITTSNQQKVLSALNHIKKSIILFLNNRSDTEQFPIIEHESIQPEIGNKYDEVSSQQEMNKKCNEMDGYFKKTSEKIHEARTKIIGIKQEISEQIRKIQFQNKEFRNEITKRQCLQKQRTETIKKLQLILSDFEQQTKNIQAIPIKSQQNQIVLSAKISEIQPLLELLLAPIEFQRSQKDELRKNMLQIEKRIHNLKDLLNKPSVYEQIKKVIDIISFLKKSNPLQYEIQIQKNFQCFLNMLRDELQSTNKNLEGKYLQISDIKEQLEARLNVWKGKLKKKKQKQFQQKIAYYQKQIEELNVQQQTYQRIIQKKSLLQLSAREKQKQYKKLMNQIPEYVDIIDLIANLNINLVNSQNKSINNFIKSHANSITFELLSQVKVTERLEYAKQVQKIKEKLQDVQIQWQNNEDQEKQPLLEKKRQELSQMMNNAQVKLKFIQYLEKANLQQMTESLATIYLNKINQQYKQKTGRHTPQIFFKKITFENHQHLSTNLNKIEKQLIELQKQYDQTEDLQKTSYIQRRQPLLKAQSDKIREQMQFLQFAKSRLEMFASFALNEFTSFLQEKELINSITVQVNLSDCSMNFISTMNTEPELIEKFNYEFKRFRYENAAKLLGYSPIYSNMLKKYPQTSNLIPTFENISKKLQNCQNSFKNALLTKFKNMLQKGSILSIQTELMSVLLQIAKQNDIKENNYLRKELEQLSNLKLSMRLQLEQFDRKVKHVEQLQEMHQIIRRQIENQKIIQINTQTRLREIKQLVETTLTQISEQKQLCCNLKRQTGQIIVSLENNELILATLSIKINQCIRILSLQTFSLPSYITILEQFRSEQLNNLFIKHSLKQEEEKRKKLEFVESNCRKEISELQKFLDGRKADDISQDIAKTNQRIAQMERLKQKIKEKEMLIQKLQQIKIKLQILDKQTNQLCSCLTNHKCSEKCDGKCAEQQCQKFAGHSGSHLCNKQNHTCPMKCEAEERCKKQCTQIFGHDDSKKHNCHSDHQCQENCSYCPQTCTKSLFQQHTIHICDTQKKCMFKCLFCEKQCASLKHNHDQQTSIVQIYLKQSPEEMLKRKLHLCSEQHNCILKCTNEGVCKFEYKSDVKIWKRKDCQQQYTYIEQSAFRDSCKIKIPAGQYRHEQPCSCLSKRHFCVIKCPDCKSVCQKQIGHQGYHDTQHRNQQSLIFAAEDKEQEIVVRSSDEKQKEFLFAVGDLSTPTTCVESCKIKGRAHYHLMQCKGGEHCGEGKYKETVKHSNLVYYPFPQKRYDRYLCSEYWNALNFEMPCPGLRDQFSLCNFYCPQPHDGDPKKKQFCTGTAWHSFSNQNIDHQFKCDDIHKDKGMSALQICFLVDCTGSMERFIKESRKTIKRIIKQTPAKYPKVGIKFSIVGYRDHSTSKNMLIKIQQQKQKLVTLDFTQGDKAILFLASLQATGGDDFPEAVLDGMEQVTTLSWSINKSTLKYVFHIMEAPPHGRIYNTEPTKYKDSFPDGCPCGLTHQVVIQKLNKLNLNYVIYPLTPFVNTTLRLFQQSGLKFKIKRIDKDQPEDMNLSTVSILCEHLKQTNVTVRTD